MNKTGPKLLRTFCVKAGIWMPPGWYACGYFGGGMVSSTFIHTSGTCRYSRAADQQQPADRERRDAEGVE